MDLELELQKQGVNMVLLEAVKEFRIQNQTEENFLYRVPQPRYLYYGKEVWEAALAAILCGENLLLAGPKARGKNTLAENLATIFGRPVWNISCYVNIDAAALIGTDTFVNQNVVFRDGPVSLCAKHGGFGVLDEINMAKNEALAVLHAVLDFRKNIDISGYDSIALHKATRFIATMNHGYAGTREINEALASRFVIIHMPPITTENLQKLLLQEFPSLKPQWAEQFAMLFHELEKKCNSSEISTKALDFRGLLSAIRMIQKGLTAEVALRMGIVNKSFDALERKLIEDVIAVRIPKAFGVLDLFDR